MADPEQVAVIDPDLCMGCSACEADCPTEAITMNDEDKAVVEEAKCEGCGVCVPLCPSEAISLKDK